MSEQSGRNGRIRTISLIVAIALMTGAVPAVSSQESQPAGTRNPSVDIPGATAQIQQLQNYNAELSSTIEKLSTRIVTNQERITLLREEMQKLIEAAERLRLKMESLEKTLAEIYDQVLRDQILDAISKGKALIDRLRERIMKADQEIGLITVSITEDEKTIENARKRREENERTIALLKEAISFTLEGRQQIAPAIEELLNTILETEKLLPSPARP
jgi:chromosome segregation ATPase